MKVQLLHYYIVILLFGFTTITGYGQTESQASDTVVVINAIPVSDIPAEVISTESRIKEIEAIIQPSKEIIELDSSFIESKDYLQKADSAFQELDFSELTLRTAQNHQREWTSYIEHIEKWRTTVSDRSKELQSTFEEVTTLELVWEKTLDNAKETEVASELINSSNDVLESIGQLIKDIVKQQDQVLRLHKDLSDEIKHINEILGIIDGHIQEFKSMIFVKDSPYLWASVDSTSNISFIKSQITKTTVESGRILKIYFSDNLSTVYFQLAFLLVMILLFFYLGRRIRNIPFNKQNREELRALIVVNKPIRTALVIGLLISFFFYRNAPIVLAEAFLIIYMIPVSMLSPYFIDKKYKKHFYLLVAFFVIITFMSYLSIYAFAIRIIFILMALSIFYTLYKVFTYIKNREKKDVGRYEKLIRFFLIVYFLAILASIIGNILGSVGSAYLLLSAVIKSMIFAIICLVVVTSLNSLLLIISKESKQQSHVVVSKSQSLLRKRIKPFIEFCGLLFWLYLTLIFFDIYDFLLSVINDIMTVSWMLGNAEISLGGIISFLFILFISFGLARIVKILLSDEWIKRSSIPRGMPQAISMTLRYIIIAFGIYLALAAAGIDLSKFGLLAGALGVGIGFGLQSIVYNFIAGLIISYEKTMHVGDTIEVDTLLGNVTEIGVRASKILTFDGSEVIVPNGNLISSHVINWTLSNQQRRLRIPIKTTLDANPRQIIKIMLEIAGQHPNTVNNPEPMALFDGYGDSSLDFTLLSWVHYNVSLSTKSDIAIHIYDAIKEAGYDVPIPRQRVYYSSEIEGEDKSLPPDKE